jgi:hypothetical protein
VAEEGSRRRELTELVTHHVFRHENGNEFLPVVNRKGKAYQLGRDRERRDQVLMTPLSPDSCTLLTFLRRLSSMYGPFLIERATSNPSS